MTDEPGPGIAIDLSLCHKLVELERKRKALERELKETKKGIADLHRPILQEMARAGLRNISLEDGARLQPTRSVECGKKGDVDMRAAVQALRDIGWGWIVEERYGPSKLKEHLKGLEAEMVESGDVPDDISAVLPEELRPYFRVAEVNKITVYGA